MELETGLSRSRNPKKGRPRRLFMSFLIALFLTGSILLTYLYFERLPNQTLVEAYPKPQQVGEEQVFLYSLIHEGKLLEEKVLVQDSEVYVPLELFKDKLDPYIAWDETHQAVIVTNEHQVLRLSDDFLYNELKDEQVQLSFPIRELEGTIYVPYSPLADVYPFTFTTFKQTGVVELKETSKPRLLAQVIVNKEKEHNVYVRTEPTHKAPYVQAIQDASEVEILAEESGAPWYYIQTADGNLGYIPKQELSIKGVEQAEVVKQKEVVVPWKPIGGKINLTWEHVVQKTPDPSQIAPPPGLNVVSPTWFHFQDEQGNLRNIADKRYVDWAHAHGYQVWALVTNDFNPDLTHTVLTDYQKRKKVIQQLLYFAELYDLDGINIDFENVYLKDKENLVQFMRELTPYLHQQGLVVSIDVTIKSTSEMWSMFLDRKALGEVVDYMMVMTYDEHWGSSPVAGSVASLPWVENGLKGVLEEVPAHKLILGVPFYTRIWKEEINEDGSTKVSSRAYYMETVDKWLTEKQVSVVFDEQTGQHYGEYYDNQEKATYKVWIEDAKSMEQRVQLVHKYNLAGIASWRRGFEKEEIWSVIKAGLERPTVSAK